MLIDCLVKENLNKAFHYYGISLKNWQAISSEDLSTAQLYFNKGLWWFYLSDSKDSIELTSSNPWEMYDVAEGYFKKVIKTLVERMQDPRKEKLLMAAYKNIGCIYEKKNETAKSLSFYVKALKAGLKVYSPDHLEMADIHYQIWCGLLEQDKQFEAMQRLEKVIYMLNRQHNSLKQGSDSYLPRVGAYYSLLGQFYYKQGQLENANKWFEACLTLWQDYGLSENEQGYQRVLEMQKDWIHYLNQ